MKICFACSEKFNSVIWLCPACESTPEMLESYLTFAPELAQETTGFQASYFAELANLEENNFWFTARNQLIIWALKRYFFQAKNFLEVGCGTGFVLSGIQKALPHLAVSGSEILTAGLPFAAQRINNATLFQMDARKIPFKDEFDVIGAFDVVEHIEEDRTVLSQIYQALKPGGGIILTVPQHDFLWSQQDEVACHVRRYSAKDLKGKVIEAGFSMVRMTSFVTLLLPLMLASRFNKRAKNDDPCSELKLSRLLNIFFKKIMNLESKLIQSGANLPVGGSLLLIAKKS